MLHVYLVRKAQTLDSISDECFTVQSAFGSSKPMRSIREHTVSGLNFFSAFHRLTAEMLFGFVKICRHSLPSHGELIFRAW